jgi:hypothetical protein
MLTASTVCLLRASAARRRPGNIVPVTPANEASPGCDQASCKRCDVSQISQSLLAPYRTAAGVVPAGVLLADVQRAVITV